MVDRHAYLAADGAEANHSLPVPRSNKVIGVVFAIDVPGWPPTWLPDAVDHGLAYTGGRGAEDAVVIMGHYLIAM